MGTPTASTRAYPETTGPGLARARSRRVSVLSPGTATDKQQTHYPNCRAESHALNVTFAVYGITFIRAFNLNFTNVTFVVYGLSLRAKSSR